jgi:hypothetical protein
MSLLEEAKMPSLKDKIRAKTETGPVSEPVTEGSDEKVETKVKKGRKLNK